MNYCVKYTGVLFMLFLGFTSMMCMSLAGAMILRIRESDSVCIDDIGFASILGIGGFGMFVYFLRDLFLVLTWNLSKK